MYTILINEDSSLTTSVKTAILHSSSNNQIQILWTPTPLEETQTAVYTVILHYKGCDGIIYSEPYLSDEELYKDRVRFVIPSDSVLFNNIGMLEIWAEVVTDITTTIIDDDTGTQTTETNTVVTPTTSTTLFIEEVPHHRRREKDGNTIRITRGDSLEIDVALTDGQGYPYEPIEGDEVLFTVKKSAKAQEILIQKNVDTETLKLNLVEADTEDLAFGEYRYEIEVITSQDDHYTVIKNAPFIITEELH